MRKRDGFSLNSQEPQASTNFPVRTIRHGCASGTKARRTTSACFSVSQLTGRRMLTPRQTNHRRYVFPSCWIRGQNTCPNEPPNRAKRYVQPLRNVLGISTNLPPPITIHYQDIEVPPPPWSGRTLGSRAADPLHALPKPVRPMPIRNLTSTGGISERR